MISTVPLHFANPANHQEPLALNLPDPLKADPKFLADFPKRVSLAVHHAGHHPQDVRGAVVEVQ